MGRSISKYLNHRNVPQGRSMTGASTNPISGIEKSSYLKPIRVRFGQVDVLLDLIVSGSCVESADVLKLKRRPEIVP